MLVSVPDHGGGARMEVSASLSWGRDQDEGEGLAIFKACYDNIVLSKASYL